MKSNRRNWQCILTLLYCFIIRISNSQQLLAYEIKVDDVTQIDVTDCPLQCTCQGLNVTCAGNYLFPFGLPDVTEHFNLRDSIIPDIAANSFQGLPRLKTITIENTRINAIRACAFAELEHMTSITIRNVTVTMIEGNGFSNVNNVSVIEIIDSEIRFFKSYSFHNVKFIQEFRFQNNSVVSINSYAFRNMSAIGKIEFVGCDIKNFFKNAFSHVGNITEFILTRSRVNKLQCESVTKLRDVTVKLDINNNTFTCDCSLVWMLESSEMNYLTDDSKNNVCEMSDSTIKRLIDVTSSELCGSRDRYSIGCPLYGLPSPLHTCSLKFDNPLNPDEQVDYPPGFTTPGRSAGETVRFGPSVWPAVLLCFYVTVTV